MKITVVNPIKVAGKRRYTGETCECDDGLANGHITAGDAKEAGAKAVEPAAPATRPDATAPSGKA